MATSSEVSVSLLNNGLDLFNPLIVVEVIPFIEIKYLVSTVTTNCYKVSKVTLIKYLESKVK